MAKLKQTIFDRIFRKDRYKQIFELRAQIIYMFMKFNDVGILKRIGKYQNIQHEIYKKEALSLDEVSMHHDLGEQAVIDRLKSDRDKIYKLLEPISEIDLSSVGNTMREEKINIIVNE